MDKKCEISFLNVLFCLMVIFIHTASAPVSGFLKESAAYAIVFVPWRLSAFVVQGFIFLSGLKMFLRFDKAEKNFDYKRYYLSRLKKIVLPYVISVCIFYAYFCAKGYMNPSICGFLKDMALGTLTAHFYFVIIIIQFYLLRPLWQKMLQHLPFKYAFLISIVLTFWSLGSKFLYADRVFTTYLVYWIMGIYAGASYKAFCDFLKRKTPMFCVCFALLAVCEAVFGLLHFSMHKSFGFLETLHLFYCMSAILFCMCIALRVGKYVMRFKISKIINSASYYIYLIHLLFIFIIDDKMRTGGVPLTLTAEAVIRGIFTYGASILACALLIKGKEVKLCRNLKRQK